MSILLSPAVEQDLRRPVGAVVAVRVGDEQQLRSGTDPDAAESDGQSADEVEVIGEDRAFVEPAVVIGVFEDEDAVSGLGVWHPARVGIRLGDPDPAPVVDCHRDRLNDVGLAGKEGHLEAGWDGHRPRGLLGTEPGVFVDVERRGPSPWRDDRPRLVQPEVVEVDVAPTHRLLVHQPDHDLPAEVVRQIGDDAFHVLIIVSRGTKDDLSRVLANELHAGPGV